MVRWELRPTVNNFIGSPEVCGRVRLTRFSTIKEDSSQLKNRAQHMFSRHRQPSRASATQHNVEPADAFVDSILGVIRLLCSHS